MKDIFIAPLVIPMLAQVAPVQSEWERFGITGISLAATVFIWRYFTEKQNEKEKTSTEERDRLLKEGNDKNQQIIELLKEQIKKQ